jgi:hypothetical protein
MAVLRAARQAAAESEAHGQPAVLADGSPNPAIAKAVRGRLDEETAQAFAGRQGERDLSALVAAGVAAQKEARSGDFQRAMAQARPDQGEQSPGRTVPRALGLDPVASGEYFAGMNRFARMSEQAGLTEDQRRQLLREVQQQGKVSDGLRREVETSIRQQGSKATGLSVDDLESGAQALPPTLRGPVAVELPQGRPVGNKAAGQGDGRSTTRDAGDKAAGRTSDRAIGRDEIPTVKDVRRPPVDRRETKEQVSVSRGRVQGGIRR